MNLNGLTDSLAGVSNATPTCEQCGSVARVAHGFCLACSLRAGLEGEGSEPQHFAAALAAIEVREVDWRLGHYQILEEIGRGGMGVIYRARQRHSKRIVALKRILSHQADTQETLARFRREAEAAASLDHPNILPIYEVGEGADGLPFFSMKYGAGGSLLDAKKTLRNNPRQSVALMAKVARAVDHAHRHGILHRDLKPGNIMLDAAGEPHVSDFGLAKWLDGSSDLTRTLTIYGTPGYIAPEQARGSRGELTPAADVYSLGAILFHLFTGRPPFQGENALSVIQQASEKAAPKLRTLAPALDRDLETICAKCLEREPEARYRSAAELGDDLDRWLEGRPIFARPVKPPARVWRWAKRNPKLAAATAGAVIFALTSLSLFFVHRVPPGPPLAAEKSIAVLPFKNLGGDENAYFAQGLQGEILTNLSAIADLKVSSRNSVSHYPHNDARDSQAIGRALGVAHLLEGSVQRVRGRFRVYAQLIEARSGRQRWAHTYEGSRADLFAIQSEIVRSVADQLQAKLSPRERAGLDRRPTSDDAAFALYTQGKTLLANATSADPDKATFLHAAELLNQAVSRDPDFFLAYCKLVHAHAELYFYNFDHTPERLSLAEAALQNAVRLRPDAGETHLAQAEYLYRCHRKYDRALAELALAARVLPNSARVYALTGFINRRQGHWTEAIRNLEKALQLDPENYVVLIQIAATYPYLRRFQDEAAAVDRVLAFNPEDLGVRVSRAFVELELHGNLEPYREAVRAILSKSPESAEEIAQEWFAVAWYGRDAAEAARAAAAIPAEGAGSNALHFPPAWFEGLAARLRHDAVAAQDAFTRAREEAARAVQERPEYGPSHCVLGMIDAMLGRYEEAIREGRHAVELLPVAQDSINGSQLVMYLAMIYAAAGDNDQALTQLHLLLSQPGDGSYGDFRLNPFWDPLRDDPRFQKLVASFAPK